MKNRLLGLIQDLVHPIEREDASVDGGRFSIRALTKHTRGATSRGHQARVIAALFCSANQFLYESGLASTSCSAQDKHRAQIRTGEEGIE